MDSPFCVQHALPDFVAVALCHLNQPHCLVNTDISRTNIHIAVGLQFIYLFTLKQHPCGYIYDGLVDIGILLHTFPIPSLKSLNCGIMYWIPLALRLFT